MKKNSNIFVFFLYCRDVYLNNKMGVFLFGMNRYSIHEKKNITHFNEVNLIKRKWTFISNKPNIAL